MDGADAVVDALSQVCGSKVTIFNGDTRVATTVKNAQGARAVGTKASDAVIDNVIKQGKSFLGEAMVMGEQHYAAYQPIKDAAGKTIGMLFVGVSVKEMNDMLIDLILSSTALAVVVIVLICAVVSNFFIGKIVGQLNTVVEAMKKIAGGNLRIKDLEIKTQDEIGALAESANNMKNKAQETFDEYRGMFGARGGVERGIDRRHSANHRID
jgi:HAMP domain.